MKEASPKVLSAWFHLYKILGNSNQSKVTYSDNLGKEREAEGRDYEEARENFLG